MSHVIETRVAEATTTTGTGDITLAGALVGHRAFSSVCTTADTTEYVIYAVDASGTPLGDWEEGKGTYSAANTLTRTTVTRSSNSNNLVSFAVGTKIVILTPLGSRVGLAPLGGTTGQALVKASSGDFDMAWGAAGPSTTDALTEGSTNLYHTASRVLGQVLTGLSTAAGTVVTAAHTVLEAIGFLQKQVSDNTSAISGKAASGAIGSSGLTMATARLLGRSTASTGAVEEMAVGAGMSLSSAGLASTAALYNDSGTTNAINLANGLTQRWAPSTGAQTLSFTGWPASGQLAAVLIEGVNLGAATITWPTINLLNPNGTTTTSMSAYLAAAGITLQTSGTNWFMVWSRNGGATLYGKFL